MALKAVLFDMDGVIVDTEPLHKKAFFKVFEDLDLKITPEYFSTFTGESTKNVCKRLVEENNLSVEPDFIMNKKREYFKYFFDHDQEFDLLPGVRELFEVYYQSNIKMILASSASMNTINWVFEKFGIANYFLAKISGDELKESKPNPEIFNLAAQLANTSNEECMVIEDSAKGILAAHRASIFCAAYKSKNTKFQDYSLANIVVNEFSELEPEKLTKYFQ